MATGESIVPSFSRPADADLSAGQFRAVKLAADADIALGALATDRLIGILQNKPSAAGRAAFVQTLGLSKGQLGGTVSASDQLTTSAAAAGRLITTVTAGDVVIALALQAGAINEIIDVLIVGPYKV